MQHKNLEFDDLEFDSEVYSKLKEAEIELELTGKRISSVEVLKTVKEEIGKL